MTMETYNLGNILTFESKTKKRASEGRSNGKYLFFTSSPLQNKFAEEFDFEGEYLIFGTGGNPSMHYCHQKFSTSADCLVVRTNSKTILLKYVYYFLLENFYLLEMGFKGIGLKHISKEYIKNININIPDIEIQKETILILEKAEKIKEKIKEANNKISKMIQLVFYQMFLDPKLNTNKFLEKEISDIVLNKKGAIRMGPFGSQLKKGELVSEGIRVLWIENIVNNKFDYKFGKYITKQKYKQLKGFTVYSDNILITMMGTIGRVAIVPKGIDSAIISSHLLKIELDLSKCNPIFLKYMLLSDYVQNQFRDRAHGMIMSGLNTEIIKKTKIFLPPIELQNSFAKIVEKISSISQKQSSTNIEQLFSALMQRAFNNKIIA